MLHRSKSKDRSSIGGHPSYMSSHQVASYLGDLRSYQRPVGARPPPASRKSIKPSTTPAAEQPISEQKATSGSELPERSGSALSNRSTQSHRRAQSATPDLKNSPNLLGRPLVQPPSRTPSPAPSRTSTDSAPNPQYMENGMRWMEKQEAHSLRRALEHMDIADETRLHKAAQDEASELVWKHQNPDAPYRYKEHLRKGSYSRSHSLGGGSTRSVSGSSNGSQPDNREPCDSSVTTRADASPQHEKDSEETKVEDPVERNAKIKFAESIFNSGRRRSSGSGKRKPSGSNVAAIFSNPDDKIYEETEPISPKKSMDPAPIKPSPIPTRRNPFARVQFARANSTPTRTSATPSPETKKFDKFEIQRNPPSQSRNPLYTANDLMPPFNPTPKLDPPDEEVKMKDGKEIRGDDIRAATSMKFADRSTKLPTPVLVSDSPGRPIVSFKEPKQIELKEEISHEPQPPASLRIEKKPSLPTVPSVSQPPSNNVQGPSALSASIRPAALVQARSAPAIPTTPSAFAHTANPSRRRSKPSLELKSTPPIPMINFPDSPTVPDIQISAPSVPSIAINDAPSIPTINVEPARPIPSISVDSAPAPPLPTINVSSAPPIPSISINSAPPPIPTISIGDTPPAPPSITTPGVSITPSMPPTPPPNRPLPTPTRKSASGPPNRPSNAHTKPHWSPAPPSSMSSHARATALCSSCALPIAGRIVSAAGARFHPECFRCHHCAEALECVAFYPEPDAARSERTSRIRLRQTTNQPVKASVSPASSEEEDRRLEEQDGYDENDARFYCHLDFHEFFSPRCKSCKTPIEGEVVLACGTTWHSGHFFCAQCGDPFTPSTPFVEKDGYAWCVPCHTNRFSSKCRKCRKPVIETVVHALGAEWHEGCFVCVGCGGGFGDGRYFLREGDRGQDPWCVRCEERRLKA